jgi:hypothetical protein
MAELGYHAVGRLQFAAGSDWEHCLIVNRKTERASVEKWFAGNARQVLAAEFFFDADECGMKDAFAGVRLPASGAANVFYREAAKAMASGKLRSLRDFLAPAPLELSFDSEKIEFMELGAVNKWNSFGPVRFWQAGQDNPREALKSALSANDRFLRPMDVPAAIELSFGGSCQRWLGLPVSERQSDGSYILLLEKVQNAVILLVPEI